MTKKIGGNWHKVDVWKEFVIGFKSGGIIVTDRNHPGTNEIFIPFYDFSDFKIENDSLYLRDNSGSVFHLYLPSLTQGQGIQPQPGDYYPTDTTGEKKAGIVKNLEGLLEEPRAVDFNQDVIAAAYKQKGIDFYHRDTLEKIGHFDFPGYSFIDDIKLAGNKLYIADVFGLRILDISHLQHPVLKDRFSRTRGWPKDIALYEKYVLVADVLGIKIYDRDRDFALVGKIESNKNRIAKVVTDGFYAFLSCEAVGLKIADLSDIGNPRIVSGVVLPEGVWDCAVYNRFVYLAAYTGGLIKIDFSDIKNLKQITAFREGEEVIGVFVNDRAVFAACSSHGFRIFDFDLTPVASVNGLDGRCWTVLENNGYLFAAAGKGGVYIYNVRDLAKPEQVNRIPATEARDLVIKDNYLYIADGQKGASVYDIADLNTINHIKTIPSAAFTRGIMVDEKFIYKADGDGGVEIYE